MVTEQTTAIPIKKRQSSFAKDALKLTTGATIAQAFGILVSPVIARLYAPEAFGATAVFMSIMLTLVTISCLRYEFAIMLPEKEEDASSLVIGSLFFVGIFTIISLLMVVFFGDLICRCFKSPEMKPFLWLLPIAVLANGSCLAFRRWHTRGKRYGLLSRMQVVAGITPGTTKVAAGLLGFTGPGSLICSNVLGGIVWSVCLGWKAWREDRVLLFQTKWNQVVKMFKRYKKFPLVSSWSALLNILSFQLPVLLLSIYFTKNIVGYYALGMRIIGLPLTLVGMAIGQVFFQRASEAYNQGNLSLVVANTYKRLVSLGLFPFLVLGLIGSDIFVFVFGQQWAEAGVYVQILSLWQFIVFISSPISVIYIILERQGIGLTFDIILLAFRIVSLVIGGWLGDARLALTLFAGSGVVLWIILSFLLLHLSCVSKRSAVLDILRCLLYAMPVMLILSAAKWYWQCPPWIILLIAVAGTLFYYSIIITRDKALQQPVSDAWSRVWRRKL